MKVIVISQPKSGTYLCANLLQELGLSFEAYHLSETHYQKYDLNNLDDSKKNTKKYTKKESINKSIKLIKDNHFAVSHLYYTEELETLLADYKKIIVTRNYEDVLRSWDRFATETGRDLTSSRIDPQNQKNTFLWTNTKNAFHITFEDMLGIDTSKVNLLQEFLFNEIKVDSKFALEQALVKKSLTKSNLR